jgi:hypothetical protein
MKETKEYLKKLAIEIKNLKSKRKPYNAGQFEILKLKYEFRHHHIACCELKGRTREQIERPAKYNPANQKYINQIKERIVKRYEEQQTVCISS